ncbi:DUF2092 domain-containing protein [Leptolyngbya sp. CCNP1308]|uniref:DUF2092 domain-containing protein n=1 Tax=Leptolyngbya sp. CCNP1308 TaxID=3110255 RepID=UPI002B2061E9|nr:DUF2092 domain-containing protein [Leptolyngbya sp. CCNP1308]MEA5448399.1 DUF2092 domain-containing protein [Leptolyngbya sp. CCNP1308]
MNNNHFLNQIGGVSLALGMGLGVGAIAPTPAQAQDLDPNATEVLQFMSDYLAETEALSFNADIDFEVIARTGQKLQFSSYASVLLNRPNGLHVRRQGPLADVEILFDGSQLTLFGRRINAYVQQAFTGTVDEAILAVEADTGIPFPGADLLFSDTYAVLMEGVTSSRYLGTGYINGVEVHHLAFREDDVDWQLWVQTGDRPLPMKYVITTKWLTGAPQYETRLRDWNTSPQIANNRFTFTAPAGAARLETLPTSELEDFQSTEDN